LLQISQRLRWETVLTVVQLLKRRHA
jgi:hypothetical protein